MLNGRWPLRRIILFCAVPAVAMVIVARQAYLNAYYGLSTWKGGGMGMFAGADSSDTRYIRAFVEAPNGPRSYILRMTPAQEDLRNRALLYPSPQNFRDLALALRGSWFIADERPTPVQRADADSQKLGQTGRFYHLLHADAPRARGDEAPWTLVLEYWNISFDPQTRLARASLIETMRFGPEER